MTNRNLLRRSAALLFVGVLFSLLVGFLHPSPGTPNNHPAEFAAYANSAVWTAVHLGQFVGMAVIIAGLLVLFFARRGARRPRGEGRGGRAEHVDVCRQRVGRTGLHTLSGASGKYIAVRIVQ